MKRVKPHYTGAIKSIRLTTVNVPVKLSTLAKEDEKIQIFCLAKHIRVNGFKQKLEATSYLNELVRNPDKFTTLYGRLCEKLEKIPNCPSDTVMVNFGELYTFLDSPLGRKLKLKFINRLPEMCQEVLTTDNPTELPERYELFFRNLPFLRADVEKDYKDKYGKKFFESINRDGYISNQGRIIFDKQHYLAKLVETSSKKEVKQIHTDTINDITKRLRELRIG